MRILPVLLIAVATLLLGAAAHEGWAFDDVQLYIEYNSTDDDAGIQVFVDAEEWDWLMIRDPKRKKILKIMAKKGLRELGLTELVFESGEPSLDEVLAEFPEGDYKFIGWTIQGDKLTGWATLSHTIPDAPTITSPGEGDCVDHDNTVVEWSPIVGIAGYQVIIEQADLGVGMIVDLSDDSTSLTVPPEFLEENTEYEFEVLAISANGNRTITESLFETGPGCFP
jgi:hypothetical protein